MPAWRALYQFQLRRSAKKSSPRIGYTGAFHRLSSGKRILSPAVPQDQRASVESRILNREGIPRTVRDIACSRKHFQEPGSHCLRTNT